MAENNRKNKIPIFLGLLVGVSGMGLILLAAFLYVSIGFGNAVVNTVKGIDQAKREWKNDGINPIDTMLNDIHILMDSIE